MSIETKLSKSKVHLGSDPLTRLDQIRQALPEVSFENEIRLLADDSMRMRKAMNLHKLPVDRIDTWYISDSMIPQVLGYIQRHSEKDLSLLTPEMIGQARLRRVTPIGDRKGEPTSYFIEVKMSRSVASISTRGEEAAEITARTFKAMWNYINKSTEHEFTGFNSKKRRTDIKKTETGSEMKIEIDKITAAGVGEKFRQYKRNDWKYLQIGIEVINDAAKLAVFEHRNNAKYLHGEGVVFLTGRRDLRHLASMKEISANGIKKRKIERLMSPMPHHRESGRLVGVFS